MSRTGRYGLLAVFVASCDAEASSRSPAAPVVEQPVLPVLEEGCASAASDALVEHACFHAEYGPFRDVAGDAEPPADVSRAHTLFEVALPDDAAEQGAVLRYRVRSAGGHALFVSQGVELSVSDGAGNPLVEALEHPSELCGPLPTVHVFAFPQADLLITLRAPGGKASLVIEQMDEGQVSDGYKAWCEAGDAGGEVVEPAPRDAAAPSAALPDGGVELIPDAAADGCVVDPVSDHACLHAEYGPFVALTPREAPWNVSAPHTAFRLAGEASHALRYIATRSGEYVFYSSAELALSVSRAGEELSLSDDTAITQCAGLPRARVFELAANESYDLSANNESASDVLLVIEAVQSLAPAGWKDRFEPCEP